MRKWLLFSAVIGILFSVPIYHVHLRALGASFACNATSGGGASFETWEGACAMSRSLGPYTFDPLIVYTYAALLVGMELLPLSMREISGVSYGLPLVVFSLPIIFLVWILGRVSYYIWRLSHAHPKKDN